MTRGSAPHSRREPSLRSPAEWRWMGVAAGMTGEVPSGVWVVGKAKMKDAGRWWACDEGRVKVEEGQRGGRRGSSADAGETRTTRKHMNSEPEAARTSCSRPSGVPLVSFGILLTSFNGQSRRAARHPLPCRDLQAPAGGRLARGVVSPQARTQTAGLAQRLLPCVDGRRSERTAGEGSHPA